jgi:hypothetical protein
MEPSSLDIKFDPISILHQSEEPSGSSLRRDMKDDGSVAVPLILASEIRNHVGDTLLENLGWQRHVPNSGIPGYPLARSS